MGGQVSGAGPLGSGDGYGGARRTPQDEAPVLVELDRHALSWKVLDEAAQGVTLKVASQIVGLVQRDLPLPVGGLEVAVFDTPQHVLPAPGALPGDFFSSVRVDARPQGGAVLPLQRLVDHAPSLFSRSPPRLKVTRQPLSSASWCTEAILFSPTGAR